jgi:hypothetical protein
MALPRLNETPLYDVVIPSTGKTVKFRPFLVKEQKVLLMALESEQNDQMVNAVVDTIVACIDEPIDSRTLTTFDVEYLFISIRAASVGETTDLLFECVHCETPNQHTVNLGAIEAPVPNKKTTKIKISPEVTVELGYPSYNSLPDRPEGYTGTDLIVGCLKKVQTKKESIVVADEPYEEIVAFLDSFTGKQQEKLTEFITTIPSVEYNSEFICTNCEQKNRVILKGLKSFF